MIFNIPVRNSLNAKRCGRLINKIDIRTKVYATKFTCSVNVVTYINIIYTIHILYAIHNLIT